MRKTFLAIICACMLFCAGCYVSPDVNQVDDRTWIQQQYDNGQITEAQYKVYMEQLSE